MPRDDVNRLPRHAIQCEVSKKGWNQSESVLIIARRAGILGFDRRGTLWVRTPSPRTHAIVNNFDVRVCPQPRRQSEPSVPSALLPARRGHAGNFISVKRARITVGSECL